MVARSIPSLQAVVAVDNAEWAGVVECVCLRTAVGGGGAFFRQAIQDAMVVLVTVRRFCVVEGVGEVLRVVGFQTCGHIG